MKTEVCQNLNFQSGLNPTILLKEKFINTAKQEQYLLQNYGIQSDFKQNKSIAFANRLCADIFNDIKNKLKLKINFPPFISVYYKNPNNKDEKYVNFCLSDTNTAIDGEPPFPGRSLFFKNYKSLKQIDSIIEDLFEKKKTSSNHFLTPFIHEWLHSIHLDILYKKYGYPGECKYMMEEYPVIDKSFNVFDMFDKKLNQDENQIVKKNLGEYATNSENQYLEVFSETFTKLICESLSKNCKRIEKNPLDLLNNSSDEFKKIVDKVSG